MNCPKCGVPMYLGLLKAECENVNCGKQVKIRVNGFFGGKGIESKTFIVALDVNGNVHSLIREANEND